MDAVQQENIQRKYIPGSHGQLHKYRLENEQAAGLGVRVCLKENTRLWCHSVGEKESKHLGGM